MVFVKKKLKFVTGVSNKQKRKLNFLEHKYYTYTGSVPTTKTPESICAENRFKMNKKSAAVDV